MLETNFSLIMSGIDVAPIKRELHQHAELWDRNPLRRISPNSPHVQMKDIWLRYNSMDKFSRKFNDEHIPVWYPAWNVLTSLHKPVFDLMAHEQGEMLGGVLLTCIPPGGKIALHKDDSWHVQYYEKYYLSINSKVGSLFGCRDEAGNNEILEPIEGNIYLFDNRKLHWVDNCSNEDRITLIICIRTAKHGRF